MARTPPVAMGDLIALALFAQRSPNTEFREQAFGLALSAIENGAPELADLGPLCLFAARTQAKGPSAERAREVGSRLLREAGHADLQAQLQGSIPSPKNGRGQKMRLGGRRPKASDR